MLKEALKAVIGVGQKGREFEITPLRILLFAFLVASMFLGFISLLLIMVSFLT